MSKITNNRLIIDQNERPVWWVPGSFVKIVSEKKEDFFIWHRDKYEIGSLQIDDNYSIEYFGKDCQLNAYPHSDQSIRLMSSKHATRREYAQKAKDNIRTDGFSTAESKDDYAHLYKKMFSELYNGEITTRQFEVITDRIHTLLQDWDLFNEPQEQKTLDWQETIESIINNPANSDTQKLAALKFKLEHGKDVGKKERKTIIVKVNDSKKT